MTFGWVIKTLDENIRKLWVLMLTKFSFSDILLKLITTNKTSRVMLDGVIYYVGTLIANFTKLSNDMNNVG